MFNLCTVVVLVLSSTVRVLASPALVKRSFSDVESIIASLVANLDFLDNNVNAFPSVNGTVNQGFTIHTGLDAHVSALVQTIVEITDVGIFSVTDGETVIQQVEGFQPTLVDVLDVLAIKRPLFDVLPLGGFSSLFKPDIDFVNTNNNDFEAALLAALPTDDQKARANALKATVDAAFSRAVAAYASA